VWSVLCGLWDMASKLVMAIISSLLIKDLMGA